MMATKSTEKKNPTWSAEEKEQCQTKYGCEIIMDNSSLESVRTKKAPTDSYIVKYLYKDKVCFDLTRGTKVDIFDMYYDKFKSDLKSIDYGYGTVKPSIWNYQSPQAPKKKKKGQNQN